MSDILKFPGHPRYNADPAVREAIATLTEQRGDKLDGNIIVSVDAVPVLLLYIAPDGFGYQSATSSLSAPA